jgi:hypothetical protein
LRGSLIDACHFNVLRRCRLDVFFDNRKHHQPHIHVQYGDEEAVISIPEGDLMEGSLRRAKLKLVQAWIEIHQDELMSDWELAVSGQQIFKIDPLK